MPHTINIRVYDGNGSALFKGVNLFKLCEKYLKSIHTQQPSISSTLSPRVFRTNFWRQAKRNSRKQRWYKIFVHKTLMKLTPGVDFIKVLRAAFAHVDPKSVKDTENLTEFLHFWDLRA